MLNKCHDCKMNVSSKAKYSHEQTHFIEKQKANLDYQRQLKLDKLDHLLNKKPSCLQEENQ